MSNLSDFFGGSGRISSNLNIGSASDLEAGQIFLITSSRTLAFASSVNARVTCIGGGGGSGYPSSGYANGGAGGGLGQQTFTLSSGTTYTATVGAGGMGGTSSGTSGSDGGTTSFSGSGITTLSATGGDGGYWEDTVTADGGSASGAAYSENGESAASTRNGGRGPSMLPYFFVGASSDNNGAASAPVTRYNSSANGIFAGGGARAGSGVSAHGADGAVIIEILEVL